MPTFKNVKELEKYLQKQITNSLKTDVSKKSIELMKEHIEEDVYKAYTPYSTDGITPHYERTYKLLNSNEANMIDDNTLELTNSRSDEKSSRYIVPVIEYGKGYEWGYTRDLDEEIGERPFMRNTAKDLRDGKAKEFMAEALKKRGLNVIK